MHKKRLTWIIKIGCLFVLLFGLIFNQPISLQFKKAFADGYGRGLKPIEKYRLPNPVLRGVPAKVSVDVRELDLSQAYLSNQIFSCDVTDQHNSNSIADNQSTNLFLRDNSANFEDPKMGYRATLTLDNGHIFTYNFRNSASLNDFSSANLHLPILVLQNCTEGQLYVFDLGEVK